MWSSPPTPPFRERHLTRVSSPYTCRIRPAVAVADINGDGKADLVIAQGSGVLIRLQDPAHPGAFLAPAPISD